MRTTRAACSRGRRSGAAGTTVAATSATSTADDRVGPAREGRARIGHQRRHHDRLHGRLHHEQLPAVEQDRRRHRQRHDDRQLPPARPDAGDDQVGEEHADRDPDGHLGDPPQPLAVGRPEAHDGRDGREERRRVAEQVGGDEPRHARRDRALADLPALRAPPVEPRLKDVRREVRPRLHSWSSDSALPWASMARSCQRAAERSPCEPCCDPRGSPGGDPSRSDRSGLPDGREPPHADARGRAPAVQEARGTPAATTSGELFEEARDTTDIAPLFLKHPYRSIKTAGQWMWVEDDQFDIEHHVRHSALPKPGRVRELFELVLAAAQHPPGDRATAVGVAPDRGTARRPGGDVHQAAPLAGRRDLRDAAAAEHPVAAIPTTAASRAVGQAAAELQGRQGPGGR